MRTYDDGRRPEIAPPQHAERLQQLFTCLAAGDDGALAELLADDVRSVSDGGGDYYAALKPILGRDKVIRFFEGLLAKRGMPSSIALRTLNGAPAFVAEWSEAAGRFAPRSVTWIDLDDEDRISAIYVQLAPRKLVGLTGA